MGEVVRLSNRSEIYEEAAKWIARLDKGASAADRAELERWLQGHPQHKEALIKMAALWDETDVLSELAELFPLDHTTVEDAAPAPERTRWAWAAAACVVILGAAGTVLMANLVPRWSADHAIADTLMEQPLLTPVGEHASWDMTDGSVITLNTDSEVKVEYGAGRRDVFLLRGEAHFDVASDPDRPFAVYVANGVVEAVGTAFNVRLQDERHVVVAVTEGAVQVRHAAAEAAILAQLPRAERQRVHDELGSTRPSLAETRLSSGEVAVFDRDAAQDALQVSRRERQDMDIKLAWRRGLLVFQGEPLETVLDEVGRYTTVEFVLADDSLRAVRVGGSFRSTDVSALLVQLRENFDIASDWADDDRIILRRAP